MSCQFIGVSFSSAAEQVFIGRDTDLDREVRTDILSDFSIDFIEETDSVLEASAVFIDTLVCERRKEFADQVAMRRMDFKAVKTAFLNSSCGGAEILYDLMNFINGQFLGQIEAECILDCGRGNRLDIAVDQVAGLSAGMIDLGKDL